jgi:predicted deacylase
MKRLATLLIASLCLALGTAPAHAATVLTGDRMDGAPVISALDVSDLPSASLSRFYFRVTDQATGQGWYVPVLVAKGARPGKRLLLTAAVHGDELNGIAVIQDLFKDLDPKQLSGVVIGVPGLNPPGLLQGERVFHPSIGSGSSNLNRKMPGDIKGSDISDVFAGRLWTGLFIGNADLAVDLHTQSRGTLYPMYVFAQTPGAKHMAQILRPDVIKLDPGVNGAIENMLNAAGMTAVTLELGAPEVFDPVMIGRALSGLKNLMIDQGMVSGQVSMHGPEPYIGNLTTNVSASRGGYARLMVKIGDKVKKGQVLATISDPFGQVTATVTAPLDGQVLSVATSPLHEIGAMLVRLISWSDEAACKEAGCGR